MKGINIFNADSFESRTRGQGIKIPMPIPITAKPTYDGRCPEIGRNYWVKARPIGLWNLKHRLHCALEVFKGKADIIYFHKQ